MSLQLPGLDPTQACAIALLLLAASTAVKSGCVRVVQYLLQVFHDCTGGGGTVRGMKMQVKTQHKGVLHGTSLPPWKRRLNTAALSLLHAHWFLFSPN